MRKRRGRFVMEPGENGTVPWEGIVDLVNKVASSGVEVRTGAGDLLTVLSDLITLWNGRVNLVSRKDITNLVSYHFCDSASVLPLLRPDRDLEVLDIGGSNGLPGLVLAALSPYLKVTTCDSKVRRRDFMEEACRNLDVGARFKQGRVDDKEFRTQHHEMFDLIVARAVTTLQTLLRWCMPLLRPGGRMIAYKGSRCMEEVRQAEKWLLKGGGDRLVVIGSPWADKCNPLRLFAIAGKDYE
ncbi:MAG: 16S rRNA (guanine(527)-N(7))-methyltransferase RsmG [Candidatus Eisenbacteria bacterium]